jgi:Transglycosylase SLT domain
MATKQLSPQVRGAFIVAAANKYHIPWEKLWGVYGKETAFGENVTTSSAGAEGGFQFLKATAREYNYPYTNQQTEQIFGAQADAAAHYLSVLVKQHGGNWDAALRAYSGGGYGEAEVNAAAKHSPEQHSAIEDGVDKAKKAASTGWVSEALEGAGKIVLTGVLLLAGAVLVVYGIMVAVRPRESAMSLPKVMPVPV